MGAHVGIGWGATPAERRYGVANMELGREVVAAMDEESDRAWYGELERYAIVVGRAHRAELLELRREVIEWRTKEQLGILIGVAS